jgi:hypothetical protein
VVRFVVPESAVADQSTTWALGWYSIPALRIRAYVDFALTADFDQSDIVMLSDPRLREPITARQNATVTTPAHPQPDAEDMADMADMTLPDLGVAIGAVRGVATGAAALTMFVMSGVGVVVALAVAAAGSAAGLPFLLVLPVFLLVLGGVGVEGAVLAVQRGAITGVQEGVSRSQLARRALQLVAAMPALQTARQQTLPLAHVEAAVKAAVVQALAVREGQAHLLVAMRARIERVLFAQIERATLAALRREDGLVDFSLVADQLGTQIDEKVLNHLGSWRWRVTTVALARVLCVCVVIGLLLQCARWA